MADSLEEVWAGIDIGKTHHWVCVIDSGGKVLLSAKVVNREADLTVIIAAVKGLAARVVWAVDIIGAPSALILALLTQAQQPIRYASGRVVSTMSTAFAGEGKTDSKDAYVIAETARIRRDLTAADQTTEVIRNLGILTARRADLIADRVRMINRLRDLMNSVFPTLETEFDYSSCKGALVLLTGYSSPQQLRRIGEKRLSAWLHRRHVRGYAAVAAKAIAAVTAQQITLPAQDIAAEVIAEIAADILALDQRVKTLDTQIADMFASQKVRSSNRCPGSDRFSARRCWSRLVTFGPFPPPGIWLRPPGWCQYPTIRGDDPEICTNHADTVAGCGTCSTCLRRLP